MRSAATGSRGGLCLLLVPEISGYGAFGAVFDCAAVIDSPDEDFRVEFLEDGIV
jgi:hypothetical protein